MSSTASSSTARMVRTSASRHGHRHAGRAGTSMPLPADPAAGSPGIPCRDAVRGDHPARRAVPAAHVTRRSGPKMSQPPPDHTRSAPARRKGPRPRRSVRRDGRDPAPGSPKPIAVPGEAAGDDHGALQNRVESVDQLTAVDVQAIGEHQDTLEIRSRELLGEGDAGSFERLLSAPVPRPSRDVCPRSARPLRPRCRRAPACPRSRRRSTAHHARFRIGGPQGRKGCRGVLKSAVAEGKNQGPLGINGRKRLDAPSIRRAIVEHLDLHLGRLRR